MTIEAPSSRDLPLLDLPAALRDPVHALVTNEPEVGKACAAVVAGDTRAFGTKILAMQLVDHHLVRRLVLPDVVLRALGSAMTISVSAEMALEADEFEGTERYARKLRGELKNVDPDDAVHLARLQKLNGRQRKILHRILRRHGLVPGAREAVAVALGLVGDEGWREEVILYETGLRKPVQFQRAVRMEAEFVVNAVLYTRGLWRRVQARAEQQQQEPHTAATAVLAEVLVEQTELAFTAADRASNARAVALDVGVAVSTAQGWVRRSDWKPLLRKEVQRLYLARRAVLDGPVGVVQLWRAERSRRSIGRGDPLAP